MVKYERTAYFQVSSKANPAAVVVPCASPDRHNHGVLQPDFYCFNSVILSLKTTTTSTTITKRQQHNNMFKRECRNGENSLEFMGMLAVPSLW